MKGDGVGFAGIHGHTVVLRNIVKRQNVGNAVWIEPHPFWIVPQETVAVNGDSSSIAMNVDGVLDWGNIMKEFLISNHVD
jgi:type 1 glutamine amidotransferase